MRGLPVVAVQQKRWACPAQGLTQVRTAWLLLLYYPATVRVELYLQINPTEQSMRNLYPIKQTDRRWTPCCLSSVMLD